MSWLVVAVLSLVVWFALWFARRSDERQWAEREERRRIVARYTRDDVERAA